MSLTPMDERSPLLRRKDDGLINYSTEYLKGSETSSTTLVTSFLVTLAAMIGCGGVGLGMLGRAFSKDCTNKCAAAGEYQGCFDWIPFFGVMLIVFVVPLGVMSFGTFIVELSHHTRSLGRKFVTSSLVLLCALCFVGSCLSWALMLKPATLYDYLPDKPDTLVNDALLVLIGGFIMLTLTPFTIVCGLVALQVATGRITLASSKKSSEDSASLKSEEEPTGLFSPTRSLLPLTKKAFSYNQAAIFGVIVLFAIITFCDSTFSSVWNYSAHSYFNATSEYAIIQHRVNYHFVFKVYLDVVVLYGMCAAIVILGALGHHIPSIRKVLHTRINLIPSYFTVGVTVGETILTTFILSLFAFWLWYWRWGYDRIENETQGSLDPIDDSCCADDPNVKPGQCHSLTDVNAELQIWARVFGHLTTLCLSLAILPTARNSVWESVFGVPYERAIKFHRSLGVFAWAFVTVHMLIWMVKWLKEGTLINNAFAIDYLIISERNVHFDNFTILINETSWLLLTVMVAIAYWGRRNQYELFYYTHHFAIIFYVTAVLHAWSFWYYGICGMFLWMLDRCIRLVRQSRQVVVIEAQYSQDADLTIIHFRALHGFHHFPGQYCFVNVPQVSAMQWHPFTISSHPSSDDHTFHIKNMGENTFTGQLAQFVAENPHFELRIDGPYGRPEYFDEHEHLLLVAGGIGITPIHSIAMELMNRMANNQSIGRVKHITIVWACRSPVLISLFDDLRSAAAARSDMLTLHLHLTKASQQRSDGLPDGQEPGDYDLFLDQIISDCQQSRPDLDQIASELPSGRDTMVMVCGPEALIRDASQTAFRFKFSFHSEVFHW